MSSLSDTRLCNLQTIICVLKDFVLLCPKHKTLVVRILLANDSISKINIPCHCLGLIFPNSY